MSSAEALNSIATTASEISSDAIGPMMCTPRISSVVASARNLTMPEVSPSARAAVCQEWEGAGFVRHAFSLQRLFGFADPGDFRRGVDHPRNGVEVGVTVLASDTLGHCHAFFFRFVRQHRATYHIADRPHAWQIGFAVVINRHETTLVQRQADFVSSQAVGVRGTADRHDQLVEYGGGGFAFGVFEF